MQLKAGKLYVVRIKNVYFEQEQRIWCDKYSLAKLMKMEVVREELNIRKYGRKSS